jgi:hypothetical protein
VADIDPLRARGFLFGVEPPQRMERSHAMKRFAKNIAVLAAGLLIAAGAAFAQTAAPTAPQPGTGMDHGTMAAPAATGGCPMDGPGMGRQAARLAKPLTVEDVKTLVTQRLAAKGNARLKVGKVSEKDTDTIVAEIVTVDDSLVRPVEFDRNTGRPKDAGRHAMGMGMGGMSR